MKLFKMKTFRMAFLAIILIGSSLVEAYSKTVITITLARHRDCEGFGWCRGTIVVDPISIPRPVGNVGNATVEINKEGRLTLSFNKATDLTPEAYNKYFSSGIFICEDDFPVPAEILKALGYSGSYTVSKGNYKIISKDGMLTIVF
jgi:hypothetical protein